MHDNFISPWLASRRIRIFLCGVDNQFVDDDDDDDDDDNNS